MDYQSMKRKDLQALCKKHKIPANLSNLEMANKLAEHFKEIENPPNQGLEIEQGETESTDVVTSKKVRFRPEHELIEFSRSPGARRRTTRKSVSITTGENAESDTENVGGRGRSTRSRGKAISEGIDNGKEKEKALDGVDDEKLTGEVGGRTVRVTRSRGQKMSEGDLPETKRARKLVETVEGGDVKRVATRGSSSKGVEITGKRKEEVLEGEANAKRKSSRKGVEIDGKHGEGVLGDEADAKKVATRSSSRKGVEIDGAQGEGVSEDEANVKRVSTRSSSRKGVEIEEKHGEEVSEDKANAKRVPTRSSSRKGVEIDVKQGVLEDKVDAKKVTTRGSFRKGVEIKGNQGEEKVLEITEKIEEVKPAIASPVLERKSKRNAKGSRKSEKLLPADVSAEIGGSKGDPDGSVLQIEEPKKTSVRKSNRSKDLVAVHGKGRNVELEEETENTSQLQSSTPQSATEVTRRSRRKTLIHVNHEAERHSSKPVKNTDEFAGDSIAQRRKAARKQEIRPTSEVVDNDQGSQKQFVEESINEKSVSIVEAQAVTPKSNSDPGLSRDTKNKSITRQTQTEEQLVSIEDNSNSNGMDFVARNVQPNSVDLVEDVTASNIKGEEMFDSVESDFQLVIEQDITDIVKDQFEVQPCSQIKGSSQVNTTDDQIFPEDVNVSGIEGSDVAISSSESDLHVNLEVNDAEADTHTQPGSIVIGEEGISVLDKLDMVEKGEADVIGSSIACHQNNVDFMEASNCISYDKVEDGASNAQEVIASESCEEGNKGALELVLEESNADGDDGMVRSIESEETYIQKGIVQEAWIDASETTGSAMCMSQTHGKGIASPVLEESNTEVDDGMVRSIESEETYIQKGIVQGAWIDASETTGSAMCMSQARGKGIASPVIEKSNTDVNDEEGSEGALELMYPSSGMVRSIESEETYVQKGVQEVLVNASETTEIAISVSQTHDKGITSPVQEESNTYDADGKDKYESADEFMSDADISMECAIGKLNDQRFCESGVQYAEETGYQSEHLHKKHTVSTNDPKPSPSWTGTELNNLFDTTTPMGLNSLTNMIEKEAEGDISSESAKTTHENVLLPAKYEEVSVSKSSSGVDREDNQLKLLFSTPFKIDSPTNVDGTYSREENLGGAGASIASDVGASMEISGAQIALNEKVLASESDHEGSLYFGCSSDNSEENNAEEPNEVKSAELLNTSNRVSPKSERRIAPSSGAEFGLSDADDIQMTDVPDNSLHLTACHEDTNLSPILIDNLNEGPMDGEEANTDGCLNSDKDVKNKGTSPNLFPKASNDGEDVTEMKYEAASDDAYEDKIWDEDDDSSRSFNDVSGEHQSEDRHGIHRVLDDVKPSQSWTGIELNNLFETTPHKEMEGEISIESAKTSHENAMLPTPAHYKEVSVSNPSSGVDREDVGNHLKQLFSTPIKIDTFSMVDETSTHEEKLDGADVSIAECVDTNIENSVAQITSDKKVLTSGNDVDSSLYLECSPDNGEEINSEKPNEVGSVGLPNASTIDLYESSLANLIENNLKSSDFITEENRNEKVIALGEATENDSELREGYHPISSMNSDSVEGCQDLSDNLNIGNNFLSVAEQNIAPSRAAEFELSDADNQKSNILEYSPRLTAYYEDKNLNEILADTFKEGPMDVKNRGTSPGLLLKPSDDGDGATELKHEAVDDDAYEGKIWDEKDDESRSFCDISDEPSFTFVVEKSKSPFGDTLKYPSACKVAGTSAQSHDNTLHATEGGFSVPGAEFDVFSNFAIHMSGEDIEIDDSGESEEGAHAEENSGNDDDYESGEIEKSDSGTPLFDLDDGDNEVKNENEVEENSAAAVVEGPISELCLDDEILESPTPDIECNELLKESVVDLNAADGESVGMECDEEVEEMLPKEESHRGPDPVEGFGGKRDISTSSGEFGLTAKKNARTILIHGTPGKALAIADMKENAPTHKNANAGDATAARPPKRKALQDVVHWK